MSTRLAVIIVNYRTPGLTLSCLDSLAREVDGSTQVVIVDNDSGDGSLAQLEAHVANNGWQPWVRLIASGSNRGFAGGNNVGIRAVQAEAYLLLNSDTVVYPGALGQLGNALATHAGVGLVGPRFERSPGVVDAGSFAVLHPVSELLRAARTGAVTRLLSRYDVHLPLGDSPREVGWLGFGCVLIRRQVFDQIGLLDSDYFMYFEDIDFCQRAARAGWRMLYWPRATILHFGGASGGSNSPGAQARRPPRYYYEARARYYAKHYGRTGLWLANAAWLAGRSISWPREILHSKPRHLHPGEGRDIWIGTWAPLGRSRRQRVHARPAEVPVRPSLVPLPEESLG